MLTKRIIPCLDVKGGRVVKGTNFVGLRDAGDPVELAKKYDDERADELVFLDITASHEGRGTMVEVAKNCDRRRDSDRGRRRDSHCGRYARYAEGGRGQNFRQQCGG